MSDVPIKISRRGAVLEVVLDRPRANSIDSRISRMLGEVFLAFRDDPAFRVALITGAGDQFFSAGRETPVDGSDLQTPPDDGIGGFGGLQELAGLNKPVVAAVNGIAVGGGMEMVLACDIVLAAEHARFALPDIRLGGMPEAAAVRLPRRIPHAVAMEMMLTGRWMDAREALRWGIVNEIVAPRDLMARAREVSRLIAEAAPLAVAAIKEAVRETEALALQDGLSRVSKRQLPAVARLYASEDIKEGRRAAAQKRKPEWRGR